MTEERKDAIEQFIIDWYWDKASQEFAFELADYLFQFLDYLNDEKKVSERTFRKHKNNCWALGILICQYGYHEKFTPQVFAYPPYHEFEFKRKHLASDYALKSYYSTCNKVEKYALKKGELKYD